MRTPPPTSRSTRAGAMTTAELCAWGIPTVLVPLPTAAADHQTANARALAAAGAARWIPEPEATAERIDARGRRALLRDDARHFARMAATAPRHGRAPAPRRIIAQRACARLLPSRAVTLINDADHRPIHFVGIAGAGMSALAELFASSRRAVTGCDQRPGCGATDLVAPASR